MGQPRTNSVSRRVEGLNPGPPDYKPSALTTRPRCLHLYNCITIITPILFPKYKVNAKKTLGVSVTRVQSVRILVQDPIPSHYLGSVNIKVLKPIQFSLFHLARKATQNAQSLLVRCQGEIYFSFRRLEMLKSSNQSDLKGN